MSGNLGTLFLLLDAAIGELRSENENGAEILLYPAVEERARRLCAEGYGVSVVVTSARLSPAAVDALSKQLDPIRVVAVDTLAALDVGALSDASKPRALVAMDRCQREIAADRLKIAAAPHIIAGEWLLRGEKLSFVKIETRRRPDIKTPGLLPYFMERRGETWLVFGLLTKRGRLRMIQAGASVDALPFDYRRSDCAFLRVDAREDARDAHWEGADVLSVEDGRILVALSGAADLGAAPLPSAHGSIEALLPSPELMAPPEDAEGRARWADRLATSIRTNIPEIIMGPEVIRRPFHLLPPLPDAATFLADAQRYSGVLPVSAGTTLISRHINHPDNDRAANALVADLWSMGYCAYTHTFTYGGKTLKNVIADMPGRGYLIIRPEILEKILEILKHYRGPIDLPALERELRRALGAEDYQALEHSVGGLSRSVLAEIAHHIRWSPWWRLRGTLLGFGAKIIVVGAHFDSTAGYTPGYVSTTDPAPGMDDNASGIAGCLGVARYLSAYRGKLVHTVRLCFFNAEEQGLVGSKAYATTLKSINAPVKAAICMDMIGYNSDSRRIFEIHAGYSDAAIRDKSVTIATAIEGYAASLGSLEPAQIYKGTSTASGAPDRALYDPAINRSDHGAFHQQGYGAVVVAADYFANMPTEPAKDPNPNYHTVNDTSIDASYGAAITAAVACAVKDLADG